MPSSPEARAKAEQHDREQQALAAVALLAALDLWPAIQKAVSRFEMGLEPELAGAIGKAMAPLVYPVTDLAAAARIQGRQRLALEAAEYLKKTESPAQVAEWLVQRSPMPEDYAALAREYTPAAIQQTGQLAAWMTRELEAAGKDLARGTAEHTAALLTRLETLGVSAARPFSLEGLLLTQAHGAYLAGILDGKDDPMLAPILLGYEYVSMRDEKVRPAHQRADGQFAYRGDEATLLHFEHLLSEPRCRCELVPIFGPPGSTPVLV